MRLRGFEIVSEYVNKGICLPVRKTTFSAGYDIEVATEVLLPSQEVTLIQTGIKAYMQPDEYLGIHIRSGISIKNKLSLINNQGIIDADYYNNQDNEGHILVAVYNHGCESFHLEKGTRIAQGIFMKYLITDHDAAEGMRTGGIGSTGKY